MSRVYSHRFGNVAGLGKATVYNVPAGKRAVVRCVTWANQSGTNARVWVAIAGFYVFVRTIPGAMEGGAQDLRLVAYAGETVVLATTGTDIGAHLSGYLFEDPEGPPAMAAASEEFSHAVPADWPGNTFQEA